MIQCDIVACTLCVCGGCIEMTGLHVVSSLIYTTVLELVVYNCMGASGIQLCGS